MAFVDELLQENLCVNLEARLDTRITLLQVAQGPRLARIEETLKVMEGNNMHAVEGTDFHVPTVLSSP